MKFLTSSNVVFSCCSTSVFTYSVVNTSLIHLRHIITIHLFIECWPNYVIMWDDTLLTMYTWCNIAMICLVLICPFSYSSLWDFIFFKWDDILKLYIKYSVCPNHKFRPIHFHNFSSDLWLEQHNRYLLEQELKALPEHLSSSQFLFVGFELISVYFSV